MCTEVARAAREQTIGNLLLLYGELNLMTITIVVLPSCKESNLYLTINAKKCGGEQQYSLYMI